MHAPSRSASCLSARPGMRTTPSRRPSSHRPQRSWSRRCASWTASSLALVGRSTATSSAVGDRRADAQDSPRVAPGNDQRVHQLAVAARVVGDQSMRQRVRRLERHPAGGHLAELFGDQLHPARPPVPGGAVVGEAAVVVEPVRDRRLQQAEPRLQAEPAGHGRCGVRLLEDVAVDRARLRLRSRPRNVEPNLVQAELGGEREVVGQPAALRGQRCAAPIDGGAAGAAVGVRPGMGCASTIRRCRCWRPASAGR